MKPSPKKLPLLLKKDESGAGGAMTDEKSGSAAGNMIQGGSHGGSG